MLPMLQNAFYTAAKSKIYHDIFNVGTGKPTSVNYIAKKLGGSRVKIPKRPGEPDKSEADIKNKKISRMETKS